jgi:hypothetical protein
MSHFPIQNTAILPTHFICPDGDLHVRRELSDIWFENKETRKSPLLFWRKPKTGYCVRLLWQGSPSNYDWQWHRDTLAEAVECRNELIIALTHRSLAPQDPAQT